MIYDKVTGAVEDVGPASYVQPVKPSGMTETQERADARGREALGLSAARLDEQKRHALITEGLSAARYAEQLTRGLKGDARHRFGIATKGHIEAANRVRADLGAWRVRYDPERRTIRTNEEVPFLRELENEFYSTGRPYSAAPSAEWQERRMEARPVEDAEASASVRGRLTSAGQAVARFPAAFNARLWTRLRGGTPEQARAASDAALAGDEIPEYARNVIADDVRRDMSKLNPRVGEAYGVLVELLTDPFSYARSWPTNSRAPCSPAARPTSSKSCVRICGAAPALIRTA